MAIARYLERKFPTFRVKLGTVMDATPTAREVATTTAQYPWQSIYATVVTASSRSSNPCMFVSRYYRSGSAYRSDGVRWASEIVLIPLGANAALPLTAAKVAELMFASAADRISIY